MNGTSPFFNGAAMFFEDPMKAVSLELPPGWAYNPFDSSLTDFVFIRWDRPGDMIVVHVRPASMAQEEPDEKWIERIHSEVGDKASISDMVSGSGRAISAEFSSGKGMIQRVAFIRGARVELVIEQRCMEMESYELWAPLDRVVRTVSSFVNVKKPEEISAAEFNQAIESANAAFKQKEYDAVVKALEHAIEVGTSAWLYSLAPPTSNPEIHAAVRVAQAMVHLAGFNANPSLPRNAESILRRTQRSLEGAGPGPETAQPLLREISGALESIMAELVEGTEPNAGPSVSPILAMRERGFRLANAAGSAFDSGDLGSSKYFSELAVDDLLSLIALLRRSQPQEIPEEIVQQLVEQGIKDPAAQRDTIQKAREALLFPPLNMCLQIGYCCAVEQPNMDPSNAVDILVPLAELLSDLNPADPGITVNFALSLMDRVGVLALQAGIGYLEQAEQCLRKADRLLNHVKGQHVPIDGWTRYHARQNERTLRAMDHAIEKSGEDRERLQSVRSRIESMAAQIREVFEP
jgi:hypothetical protein